MNFSLPKLFSSLLIHVLLRHSNFCSTCSTHRQPPTSHAHEQVSTQRAAHSSPKSWPQSWSILPLRRIKDFSAVFSLLRLHWKIQKHRAMITCTLSKLSVYWQQVIQFVLKTPQVILVRLAESLNSIAVIPLLVILSNFHLDRLTEAMIIFFRFECYFHVKDMTLSKIFKYHTTITPVCSFRNWFKQTSIAWYLLAKWKRLVSFFTLMTASIKSTALLINAKTHTL